MAQWHGKSKRKSTGGLRASLRARDRILAELGGIPSNTTIAISKEPKREHHNRRGKTTKVKVYSEKFVYATDAKNKVKKLEILAVEANDADRQFARRNIITKGAVLKAKDGSQEVFVRVSSRPGQSGSVLGVILEKYEPIKETKAKKKAEKKEKSREIKEKKADSKPKEGKENEEKTKENEEKAPEKAENKE
ncbi:30S ribosomal protein S8e [archaeon]|nr:30S ribosomal protein S8e [archaeon]